MMVPQVLSFGSGEGQETFLEIAQLTASRFTTKPYADQGLIRFVRTYFVLHPTSNLRVLDWVRTNTLAKLDDSSTHLSHPRTSWGCPHVS